LPDEVVTLTSEFDIIFSDYFVNYSDTNPDNNLKSNPANIPRTPNVMKIISVLESLTVAENSYGHRATRSVSNFFSTTFGSVMNYALGWFAPTVTKEIRLGGGSTTLSRKPNNKNKKTKKLIRDKR
jgi:hypothetical protein